MLTGCQRRSEEFCSTEGLTQLTGHIPERTSDNSWPTRRLRASSKRAEAEATCAVIVTFSMLSIGLLCDGGSVSSTSSAAWAIQPSSNALISASSFTVAPRPVLIKVALGFGTRHAPERYEPKRLPHQPWDLEQGRTALGPASVPNHLVLYDQAAKARQQQHHGVIGHFLDERVGDVGDGNTARGRRLDVHAVDADGAERDNLAVFEGIDDRLRNPHALAVDGIGGPGCGDKLRLIGRRLDDLGADRIERFTLQGVTPAGNRETRAFRRHHFEFRHCFSPDLTFRCWLSPRQVAAAPDSSVLISFPATPAAGDDGSFRNRGSSTEKTW